MVGCPGFTGTGGDTDIAGEGDSSSSSASASATTPITTSNGTGSASGTATEPPSTMSSSQSDTNSSTSDTQDGSSTSDENDTTGSSQDDSSSTTSDSGPTDSDSDSDSDSESDSDSDSDTNGQCQQQDQEPNDGPGIDPVDLGQVQCNAALSTLDGTILDGDDTDLFEYVNAWTCSVDDNSIPQHAVAVAAGEVLVCIVPFCLEGTTTVSCAAGTATKVDGVTGCCSSTYAAADLECDNEDDNLDSFAIIGVDASNAVCEPYTLQYGVSETSSD